MLSLESYLEKYQISLDDLSVSGLDQQLKEAWNQIDPKSPESIRSAGQRIQSLIIRKISEGNPFFELDLYEKPEEEIQEEAQEEASESGIDEQAGIFTLNPIMVKGQKLPSQIESASEAMNLASQISEQMQFLVTSVSRRQSRVRPRPPFTTSTLQQAASSFLGYSPKTTMQLAQKLYEGVDIDGQSHALITYMRTDSMTLSQSSIQQARKYIQSTYPQFLPQEVRVYKNKSKNAQEAHEAIRPTDPQLIPSKIKTQLEARMWRLYDLIWRQTIACQMADEIREITTFELENSQQTKFSGSNTISIFAGWKALYSDRQKNLSDNAAKEQFLRSKWLSMFSNGELA